LPFVSPVTVIGDAIPDAPPCTPPFDDVHMTSYRVISLPPSDGAANATVTCALPEVTVGAVGASGTRVGTTAVDGIDGALSPFSFDATTVHVYVLPFVRPVTTIGDDAPVAEPGAPPSLDTQEAV
jgi:hypothetical protein